MDKIPQASCIFPVVNSRSSTSRRSDTPCDGGSPAPRDASSTPGGRRSRGAAGRILSSPLGSGRGSGRSSVRAAIHYTRPLARPNAAGRAARSEFMRPSLSELDGKSFDVVVIGAGVNGASAAQHLAAAGYATLLVDKGDYASGSSSHSTRLLHCGLRYLAPGKSLLEFVRHPS